MMKIRLALPWPRFGQGMTMWPVLAFALITSRQKVDKWSL